MPGRSHTRRVEPRSHSRSTLVAAHVRSEVSPPGLLSVFPAPVNHLSCLHRLLFWFACRRRSQRALRLLHLRSRESDGSGSESEQEDGDCSDAERLSVCYSPSCIFFLTGGMFPSAGSVITSACHGSAATRAPASRTVADGPPRCCPCHRWFTGSNPMDKVRCARSRAPTALAIFCSSLATAAWLVQPVPSVPGGSPSTI